MEIVGHEYVTGACGIVPGNGNSTEEGTDSFDGDGVQFLEGLDEVAGVLLANIFNPKVVDDEGEVMSLLVCFQSAGVLGTGENPKWAR